MCFVCASAAYRIDGDTSDRHISSDESSTYANDSFSLASTSVAADFSPSSYASYANTLIGEASWSGLSGQAATVSYSFSTTGMNSLTVYADSYRGFNNAEQQAARNIMEKMSAITNITFEETANPFSAQIQFYVGDLGPSYAGIAGFIYSGSTMSYVAVGMDDDTWNFTTPGTFGYETLMHEIGHAVGLKHPRNYSGQEIGPFLPAELDSTALTVMSYNNVGEYNTDYQELDILALQQLYGQASDGGNTQNSGGSTASSTDVNAVLNETLIATNPGEHFGGLGADTISGSSGGDTIYGGRGTVDADDVGDSIQGYGGNDEIYGNTGNDVIYGDDQFGSTTGNDTVYGGFGYDTIYGGAGDDQLNGGGGMIHPVDEADVLFGGDGNDFIIPNGDNDTAYGGNGNDTVYGGLGDDQLYGDDGNDLLSGQLGNDTFTGGAGADIFLFPGMDGHDVITDFSLTEDRIQIHNYINGTTIFNESDMLSRISDSGGNAVIDLGGGSTVSLLFVAPAQLTADHFEILH